MDRGVQNILGLTGAVALVFLIVSALWYVSAFSATGDPDRTFQVQGEGKVVVIPDVAQISFGVLTEGGMNLGQLQADNAEKANNIIGFLKDAGVEEKDIRTQNYSISPRYQYFSCPKPSGGESRPCSPPEIVGYTISQTISVKVRDLEKAGGLLGGVVDRGANNVSGPNFTIDDPDALQNEARGEAIAKAREKAEAMAKAGGFSLGRLLSIQEDFSSPVPYYGVKMVQVAQEGVGGAAPDIEPGSQDVTVTVTLTYEIR